MVTLPSFATVQDVIDNHLDQQFDSHEFIDTFIRVHEREYVEGLSSAIDEEGGIFRAYHAQIGLLLSRRQHELGIRSLGRVTSENIKGYDSENELWVKA